MNNIIRPDQKFIKEQNIIPLLQLAVQLRGGGVKGTGSHKVKLLALKEGSRKEFMTGKIIDGIWYLFEEEGMKKK